MKYEILNKLTNEVQVVAEIDCNENESNSIKLGLAVKWAIKNNANLSDANLRGADLSSANLSSANFWCANLWCADLSSANLIGANLRDADLSSANFWGANLSGADLRDANLRDANIRDANLSGANLSGANLWGATLSGADLRDANLRDANIRDANGDRLFIKILNIFKDYPITYTKNVLQIGCERHNITEWWGFDDECILKMDGKNALKFWRKNKELIKQIIETNPAEG